MFKITIEVGACDLCVMTKVCKFKEERKALIDEIKLIYGVNDPNSPFPVSVGCNHFANYSTVRGI